MSTNNNIIFRTIHHVDQKSIDEMYSNYSPVFILSTGRAGTKFLATLMGHASNVVSYHEAEPRLQYFSDFAYHNQSKIEVLKKMIDAARMELVLDAYIKNKVYVECNQCLTFFAPAIREFFKRSKFVHIVRHPGDFVKSAVQKGWHKNDSIWESGRVKMANKNEWEKVDQVEKLSWVWYTTNQFIEDFTNSIVAGSAIAFRIEDLFNNEASVRELFNFIGIGEISVDNIKRIQDTQINELVIRPDEPTNMKKLTYFPKYQEWEKEQKDKVKKYCNKLATVYEYEL